MEQPRLRISWMKPFIVTIGLFFLGSATSYKPVIFMHGFLADPTEWTTYSQFLSKYHPGTNITIIDAFNGAESTMPMWVQVKKIWRIVEEVMNSSPEGVHLVCFSQGGLICRGLLEAMDHKVNSFISISSPLAGQFGYIDGVTFVKDSIYEYFYTEVGQLLSVANYWNDPHHQTLYKKNSKFLAVLNNESTPCNPESGLFKKHFLKLKRLVLLGSPDDGVIFPWQSSHFGFYDKNENVVEMRQQEWYKKDSFGLKTLDERGAIRIHIVPNVPHLSWPENETLFTSYILHYLD